MRKTRVLINALSARQGGGQTYLINLLRHIPLDGKIEVILLAPESLHLPDVAVEIMRLQTGRWLENPFVRACWQTFVLPRYLKRYAVDILFSPGGFIGRGFLNRVKTVVTFQNMLPFDERAPQKYPYGYERFRIWLLRRVLLGSMARVDLVLFISDYGRSVIERLLHGQLNKSVVIPHGVAQEFIADHNGSSERPSWLPQEEYFLYVSTYDFYKAQIEVARGFALYLEQSGLKQKLLLVGPQNRAYGDRLRREVARLGMEENIILVGSVPSADLPALYQHASVNIFASEVENCPNILLEMMASGRPAVVSNRAPMPEIGGDAVCYFDPSRPEDLAERLRELMKDRAQREFWGGKARERSRMYDWENSARLTWQAIASLAQ